MREFDREAFERAWRESGLSVVELARRVGVPHSHQVYSWLRGEMRPTVRYLRALAHALDVAAHQLTRTDPATATLRDLRIWAGYTQGQLAERAGMSVSRYASVEQGRIKGRDEQGTTKALAGALDTDVGTIRDALARTRRTAAAAARKAARARRPPTPEARVRLTGLRADLERYGALLSLDDVAEILGVHPHTAERYARDGLIPAHRIPGGRRYYIFKDELVDVLRADPGTPHGDDVDDR